MGLLDKAADTLEGIKLQPVETVVEFDEESLKKAEETVRRLVIVLAVAALITVVLCVLAAHLIKTRL